jgi:hypothetical protein
MQGRDRGDCVRCWEASLGLACARAVLERNQISQTHGTLGAAFAFHFQIR